MLLTCAMNAPRGRAEVEALVKEGLALGLRLERLTEAQAWIAAARKWDERASTLLGAADAAASQHRDQVPS